MFRFKPENKFRFHRIDKFQTLFLVKFQGPTVLWIKITISSQIFLQNRLRKSRCNMLFASNLALEQEVLVAAIMIALFIFAHF